MSGKSEKSKAKSKDIEPETTESGVTVDKVTGRPVADEQGTGDTTGRGGTVGPTQGDDETAGDPPADDPADKPSN